MPTPSRRKPNTTRNELVVERANVAALPSALTGSVPQAHPTHPLPTPAEIYQRTRESVEDQWRRDTIDGLMRVFYVVNIAVLAIFVLCVVTQTWFKLAPPVVTAETLKTLVAGSVIELGALAAFVGRSLARPK